MSRKALLSTALGASVVAFDCGKRVDGDRTRQRYTPARRTLALWFMRIHGSRNRVSHGAITPVEDIGETINGWVVERLKVVSIERPRQLAASFIRRARCDAGYKMARLLPGHPLKPVPQTAAGTSSFFYRHAVTRPIILPNGH